MISLVVPVAYDGLERERNWQWLKPLYPIEWELIECIDALGVENSFSKGRAVTPAVERSRGDVLVIADADLYIDIDVLHRAVERVSDGVPWVVPHGIVYRLARSTSRVVCRMPDPPRCMETLARRHDGPIGGGFVVCSRKAYDTVRGFDPRFRGWGGEDISFGRALDTLVGSHERLWAPTWHLWHRPMQRIDGYRASRPNELLANRYLDAMGDELAMRAIIEEW